MLKYSFFHIGYFPKMFVFIDMKKDLARETPYPRDSPVQINDKSNVKSSHVNCVKQMSSPELTQMVRPGLPGVQEPGRELELSDEDLVG